MLPSYVDFETMGVFVVGKLSTLQVPRDVQWIFFDLLHQLCTHVGALLYCNVDDIRYKQMIDY
jgi:hypothetical protein